MADSPASTPHHASALRAITRGRLIFFCVLIALLIVAVVLFWTTRDAMSQLSFADSGLQGSARNRLVDLRPWQTAEALAPLASSSEESEYAHQAEHLADHEVDQAFAAALRQARLDAQHRKLGSDALALKQKVASLQQLLQQDQAVVNVLTSAKSNPHDDDNEELQVAKAQLGLDSDELTDAQRDFDRASNDDTVRIQSELSAHEESMRKYDTQVAKGQLAVITAAQYDTLAAQIRAWFSQRDRNQLIEQAIADAQAAVTTISTQHNTLEQQANATTGPAVPGQGSQLQTLQDSASLRQILSIDDDRIQTEQQLAEVYSKWSTQVLLQHRIVFHLILGSLLVIVFILIAMLICDAIVRRLMARWLRDRRQMRTVRSMVEVCVQIAGVVLILLVIFGAPRQTPTIIGLTTAAITFALQDYIVAFLGWFTLMGKNGIHVGDWVEINSVSGEVLEFKLMSTTLLETGGLADQGHPTGRRITFMNSYAIRGQFFNFSTAGQWMWDEIAVSVPSGADIHLLSQEIQKAAEEETHNSIQNAEREWRQSVRDENLARFSAAPVVNLRPSGSGIDLQLRFVTAADQRFELRNRLYQRVVDILHESHEPAKTT